MNANTSIVSNGAAGALWDAAADGWEAGEPALAGWLTDPTATMIAAAGIRPGDRVLDVAAGGGHQALAVAARVGPGGRVSCVDISPELVARLRRTMAAAGLAHVEARVADAQAPMGEEGVYDAAVSRLGLMLMPEPARCLAAVRAALKPGGRFAAMVFAGPEHNPLIRILMATALKHAGLPPRDPFAPGGLLSLGAPGFADRLFAEAGFDNVSTFRIDAPFRLAGVDDYVGFLRRGAAPVNAILARLSEVAREAAWVDIAGQLSVYQGEKEWVGPNALLVTSGRR